MDFRPKLNSEFACEKLLGSPKKSIVFQPLCSGTMLKKIGTAGLLSQSHLFWWPNFLQSVGISDQRYGPVQPEGPSMVEPREAWWDTDGDFSSYLTISSSKGFFANRTMEQLNVSSKISCLRGLIDVRFTDEELLALLNSIVETWINSNVWNCAMSFCVDSASVDLLILLVLSFNEQTQKLQYINIYSKTGQQP